MFSFKALNYHNDMCGVCRNYKKSPICKKINGKADSIYRYLRTKKERLNEEAKVDAQDNI